MSKTFKIKSLDPFYKGRELWAHLGGQNKKLKFDQNGEVELDTPNEVLDIYTNFLEVFSLDPEFDLTKLDIVERAKVEAEEKATEVAEKLGAIKQAKEQEATKEVAEQDPEEEELEGVELTDVERSALNIDALMSLDLDYLLKIAKVSGLYNANVKKYKHETLAKHLFKNVGKLKRLK